MQTMFSVIRRAAAILGVGALLSLGAAAPTFAGPLQIAPVRVDLNPETPLQTLRLRNAGEDPVVIEQNVMAWSQVDGEDSFAPTEDIIVCPPIFELAPGAEQILRVGIIGAPAEGELERSYRLFVREVLPEVDEAKDQLRLAVELSLPVFIAPENADKQPPLHWTLDREGRLSVRNDGNLHVRISAITLHDDQGRTLHDERVLKYALPGAAIGWRLEGEGFDEAASLTAVTDQGRYEARLERAQ